MSSSDWSRKSSIWNNSSSLGDKANVRYGGGGPVLHEHPHGAGLFPGYHHHSLPAGSSSSSTNLSAIPQQSTASAQLQLENLIQSIQGLQVSHNVSDAQAYEKVGSLEFPLKELQKMLSSNGSNNCDSLDDLDVKHLIGGKLFDEVVEEKKVSAAGVGRRQSSSVGSSPSRINAIVVEDRNELKRNHSVVAASKKKEAEPPAVVPANVFSSSSSSSSVAASGSKFTTPRKPPKSAKHLHEGSPSFGGGSLIFNDSVAASPSSSAAVSPFRDDITSEDASRHKKVGAKVGYVCHLCKAVGEHKIHECPSRFQIQKAGKKFVCKLCQGPHIVYKCPQFKHSVPSAGYICKICGEDGDHWFYNCPHK